MTSGNRPAPEQGSWEIPGAASAHPPVGEPAPRSAGRGRPGLVALMAALAELVIIAAAGNQAVAKHASRYFADHESTFLGRTVGSSLSFSWRVTAARGDNRGGSHVWASELVTIGVFVVLSALLAGLAVRGAVTFWRAFFAVWTAVLAAACVAHVVGAFATKPRTSGVGRASAAVFDSVDGATVFAGAVLGLLTALTCALVAVSTRRAVVRPVVAAAPAPAHVPEAPPPFYGNAPQRESGGDAEVDGRTTQIPRFDPPGGGEWSPPRDDGGTTQAMPADGGDERR